MEGRARLRRQSSLFLHIMLKCEPVPISSSEAQENNGRRFSKFVIDHKPY